MRLDSREGQESFPVYTASTPALGGHLASYPFGAGANVTSALRLRMRGAIPSLHKSLSGPVLNWLSRKTALYFITFAAEKVLFIFSYNFLSSSTTYGVDWNDHGLWIIKSEIKRPWPAAILAGLWESQDSRCFGRHSKLAHHEFEYDSLLLFQRDRLRQCR
jgi:hypothetical protein